MGIFIYIPYLKQSLHLFSLLLFLVFRGIVEIDGPPSLSLDESKTGENVKYPWVGVMEGMVGEKTWRL